MLCFRTKGWEVDVYTLFHWNGVILLPFWVLQALQIHILDVLTRWIYSVVVMDKILLVFVTVVTDNTMLGGFYWPWAYATRILCWARVTFDLPTSDYVRLSIFYIFGRVQYLYVDILSQSLDQLFSSEK